MTVDELAVKWMIHIALQISSQVDDACRATNVSLGHFWTVFH